MPTDLPGPTQAIQLAASQGYEAVMLVVILMGFLGMFGFISKWFIRTMDNRLSQADIREERLAKRVSELESFVEHTLTKLIGECSASIANNTQVVNRLIDTLNSRPCFWDADHQEAAVDRRAAQIKQRA
jgi:hypothetical protein